ncbi:MAG: RNA-directed DNA polymerase [Alphaproteobacteria bacterium]|nr:RNA-directed DNA polymerase [Alphaproteobacteria bacterium]
MTLFDDLIRRGYFPENLPAAFSSENVADFFVKNPKSNYLSEKPVRPATYNASKRGLTRRTFSLVHPNTCHDMAKFASDRWLDISKFFEKSSFSLSIPEHTPDGDRALKINSHSELETARLTRLSQYRFIAKTDISRFYHSIYTHSLPWAFHGKSVSKKDRKVNSASVFFNRADRILQNGQDGQTIGIPVGPDASRIYAEVVSTAIDEEFLRRCKTKNIAVIRHVDDVWIGANSHADAENALWRYREAIREYELDINESKTQIYSDNFSFSDNWPSELSTQFDTALASSTSGQVRERLRAACEHSFTVAVTNKDDAILKYIIRYLDRSDFAWAHWDTVEPFLKRAAVHFGHTVDYIARVLIWRHLTHNDLDINAWSSILTSLLQRHGRIGNDSEVSWGLYACIHLKIKIEQQTAIDIALNCGALSILALLNCVELNLVNKSIFKQVLERFSNESAKGHFWPIILEWKSRQWTDHNKIQIDDDIIKGMSSKTVTLFDSSQLPAVFDNFDEADFGDVSQAIEARVSQYDDDTDDDNDDDGLAF